MSDNYRLNYRGLQTYDRDLKAYIQNSLPKTMVGATKYHDGSSGLTPAPNTGEQNKYLKGDGTWSDIPSFITLSNTNPASISFEQEETEVGFIICNLTKRVDLESHLTLSFYSSENCIITVRMKDDNVEELYSPQQIEVSKGYNSFGIPHAYLNKQPKEHYFTITMQCSNGKITIPTKGLLYTIFGAIDNDNVENIVDILDIAIKRTSNLVAPSEIWGLGFNEENLILKKNEYNNPNNGQWEDIYDFGTVKDGKIEFDGRWIYDEKTRKEILITEENPFVFILDDKNNLKCFSNGDYSNGITLATNVSKFSACVGYKSNIDMSLEQGLIVAYIKNGNAYYRQYKYYDELTKSWYAQEEIYTGGDAISINIHRLPDYRIGIIVKTNSESKWYITDRTFIGNTYKTEYANSNVDGDTFIGMVELNRINEKLGVATLNEFEPAYYHNVFEMTFEGEIKFLNNKTIDDFKKTVWAKRGSENIAIKSIEIENNKIIVTANGNGVQGGSNFSIGWNFKDFITTNKNNSKMEITQSTYTWYLPTLTIYGNYTDRSNISIDGNTSILMKPVVDINETINDISLIGTSGKTDIIVHPIINIYQDIQENSNININGMTNINVNLVGDIPI